MARSLLEGLEDAAAASAAAAEGGGDAPLLPLERLRAVQAAFGLKKA